MKLIDYPIRRLLLIATSLSATVGCIPNAKVDLVAVGTQSTEEATQQSNTIELYPVTGEGTDISTDEPLLILPSDTTPHLYPHDTEIGQLQVSDAPARDIYSVAHDLLTELVSGTILEEALYPSARANLVAVSSELVQSKHPPVAFRIGRIEVGDDSTARMTIRLFSDVGRSAGEFYMEEQEEVWYVREMIFDYGNLSRDYIGTQFQPDYYSDYGSTNQ